MLSFADFETFLYGSAAVVDTAVLLVVLERRNWGRILVPLTVLVTGTWLYHAGTFVHTLFLYADAAWAPLLQWSAMMVMAAGLVLLPSATVHMLWRLARAGFSVDAAHHRRVIALYLPALVLIPVGQRLWVDPRAPFLDLLQPMVMPYVGVVIVTNTLVAIGCFWLRKRFTASGERAFTVLLATALLIIAGSYGAIFFAVLPAYPDWYHQLIAGAALAPVILSLVLAYSILRFGFMRMVLKRSVLYGAVVIAMVLLHRLVLEDMWNALGDVYNFDFVLIEGLVLVLLVLGYQPFRERAAEALHYLMGERAAETRERARELALEMSGMFGERPETVLGWFVESARAALQVEYVAIWQIHQEAVVTRSGETGRLDAERAVATYTDLVRAEGGACTVADAPTRAVARAMEDAEASLAVALNHPSIDGLLLFGARPRRRELSQEQLNAVLMLVEQLGITLNNSVLQTERLAAERRALLNEKLSTLGLIAGSIAHEVKNPLSSIKTIATVMQEDLGGADPHAEDLRLILTEIERLSQRVGDILSFARPATGSEGPASAAEAINGTMRVMRHLAKQRGVTFEVDVADGLPTVAADENALREVFFNLLANAIEAAGAGGEVRVTAVAEGDTLVLRVADTGPGIPPEVQEKLFQPFASNRKNGTGLGLYVVSRRVSEMGGEIQCASNPGAGTTFTITLPVAP